MKKNHYRLMLSHAIVCSYLSSAMLLLTSLFVQAEIVINEIHFDPIEKSDRTEFIELYNNGENSVSLDGWRVSGGLDYAFPQGTNIGSGEYLVISEDPARLLSLLGATSLGPFTGHLDNDTGDQVRLRNAAEEIVDEVNYGIMTPWPGDSVGEGSSMELINPDLNNDLGGSWRASGFGDGAQSQTILEAQSPNWRYRKGTSEASNPQGAWRELSFTEDGSWQTGQTSIGYADGDDNTTLSDMRNSYSTVYLRHQFEISDPALLSSTIKLSVYVDDGCIIWINGTEVIRPHVSSGNKNYNSTANNHEATWEEFIFTAQELSLQSGTNIIAVHGLNQASGSSDFSIDVKLEAVVETGGPSPGEQNHQWRTNAPPQARQIAHSPKQPTTGQATVIIAKVTDPDGVQAVTLAYQIVEPGSFLPAFLSLDRNTLMGSPLTELSPNPAFEDPANWTNVSMTDDGTGADAIAGDGTYSASIPAQTLNRTLVRYRVTVEDTEGASVRLPYLDDPSLNFAYFVYDGLPDYEVSSSTAYTGSHTYTAAELNKVPVYHIITNYEELMHAYAYSPAYSTWNIGKSNLNARRKFNWECAFVFEGEVYDHVGYRLRQSNDRYAQNGKRSMRFRFRKGNYLQTHDYFGRDYPTRWRTMNVANGIRFSSSSNNILTEDVNYTLFDLFSVSAPETHMFHMRVIDSLEEAPAGNNGQYYGDFYGLFLALENYDSNLLESQDLPDGNMYKLRDGFPNGEDLKKTQGRYSVTTVNDYNNIRDNLLPSQSESWLNQYVDYERVYRYHTIIEAIRGYDTGYFGYKISNNKNQVWFFDSTDLSNGFGRAGILPHDTDASWSQGYPGTWGNSQYKEAITLNGGKESFLIQQRNHFREFRDLVWQPEIVLPLIEERAAMARELSKADQDRWNGAPADAGFNNLASMDSRIAEMHAIAFQVDVGLRNDSTSGDTIVGGRAGAFDIFASEGGDDTQIPATPVVTYTGVAGYPVNGLNFQSSSFSDPQGVGTFHAMKWRIGEVTDSTAPSYDANDPLKFEIETLWEQEFTTFTSTVKVPSSVVKTGHTYRVRVQMQDSTLRWSHWSPSIQFTVNDSDTAVTLVEDLRISEIMFHPPGGEANGEAEFIEIYNSGSSSLQLEGASFTSGVTFTFPAYELPAGGYVLLVRDMIAFGRVYPNASSLPIAGVYTGKLSDRGETLKLRTSIGGALIADFDYNDGFGWPYSVDGAGHSLLPRDLSLDQAANYLSYGGNWTASYAIGGTPGTAESSSGLVAPIVINEFAAHTDYTGGDPDQNSNDWIEIFHTGTESFTFDEHWYLSDDSDDLKKWRIPAQSLAAGSWKTFTEVDDFHVDPLTGFGLNKAGEAIFLSHLPGTSDDRVVDSIRFKGQANGASQGRYPDGNDFWAQLAPTPDTANVRMLEALVIEEVMYHPSPDLAQYEFIEIYNSGDSPQLLSEQETTPWAENWTANWRIDGGISFSFPSGSVIGAKERVVLVSFDPLVDTTLRNNFLTHYNVAAENITLMGPYTGSLSNKGERVAIEKPQAPDSQGDVSSWIVIDEIIYSDSAPWDDSSDGGGKALQRKAGFGQGNDPEAWAAGLEPSPGRETPKIAITSPAPLARYVTPAEVLLKAGVESLFVSGERSVEFFVDETSVGTVNAEPYELLHRFPDATATYTLHAELSDSEGTYSSNPQNLTVYHTRPIITLTEKRVLNSLFSDQIVMDGEIDPNGLPADMIASTWTQSGPAFIWLSDISSPTTTARFTEPGIYTLSLVTTFGGQSETRNVEVEVLAANAVNRVPYEESFEGYDLGHNLVGIRGWYGTFAEIIRSNSGRTASNVPILDATHEQSIRLQETLVNRFENTESLTDIWFDSLIECRLWNEDELPAIDENEQFAIHFNQQGHPMIWHEQSGGGDGWTELPTITVSNGQWMRLTVRADFSDSNDPGFGLWFDGVAVTSPMSFFASAGTNASPFTEIEVQGASSIDDLVVDDYDVLNFRKLTVASGENGQSSPEGESLVPIGQSVQINAVADNFYFVDSISLDGQVVVTGSLGSDSYTIAAMNSRHSVSSLFDAKRTTSGVPHWWLNQMNPAWVDNFDSYAQADFDQDGLSTGDEYVAGTNPVDAQDLLRLLVTSGNDEAISISWLGVNQRRYSLLRSSSLSSDADWQVVATMNGDGSQVSWEEPADIGTYFYKVVVNYDE